MSGKGFEKMFRTVGPVVAMAAMSGVMAAARRNGKVRFGWDGVNFGHGPGKGMAMVGGVPLDELDMSGEAPVELVLAGADSLVVGEGEDFTISIQGGEAARERLRFRLKDGALQVSSDNTGNDTAGSDKESIATINVTLPALNKVTIAGSGEITVERLAGEAEVVIAGSGRILARDIAADRLDLSIAGSGKFKASGTVRRLDLSVAGSGSAKMAQVEVEKARVTIAGSGNAVFACDGEVKARIMGSGDVTVRGGARCKVQSMGSGTLVCERRPASEGDPAPPVEPED